MKAADVLRQAAEVIEERGKLRDKEDGERSMQRAVEAYIALRGSVLEGELDGWLFMAVLKLARATAGKPHEDDWTDLAGYAALAAECLSNEQAYEERFHEAVNKLADRTETASSPTDGWIEHHGHVAPAFKGDVRVFIRDNDGWESDRALTPNAWGGWAPQNCTNIHGQPYRITHYKIEEED